MAAKKKSGASKAKKAKKTTKKKGASGAKKKTTKAAKKSTGAKKKTGAKKPAKKASAKKPAKKSGAKKSGGKVKKSVYLEFVGGSSAKFWEGSVQGNEFHVRYGRIGSDGALKLKSFDDPADAQAAYVKVMEQKLKKGYGVAKKPKAAKAAKAKAAPKKAKAAKKSTAKKKPATPPATKKSTAYLEFVGGSSSKFWEGKVKGSDLHVRYGRIGTDGATQLKSFDSKEEARAAYDKLVHQKIKKGYALIK